MTRSMSNEQIVAKFGLDGPERIPAPDPKPFVRSDGSVRHRHNPSDAGLYPWCKFSPRPWPELQALGVTRAEGDVNPILSWLHGQFANRDENIYMWIGALKDPTTWVETKDATAEQVDSARVILERLARLQAVSA